MHFLRRGTKLLNLKSAFLNLKSLWGQLKARFFILYFNGAWAFRAQL
jgi:hypothetical protein